MISRCSLIPALHADLSRPGRAESEGGFSLMEALVAATISVIAVIGLAHSFGMGRAFINRYEVARAALGAVGARMEELSVLPAAAPELTVGAHPATPEPFTYQGVEVGTIGWRVEWFDDPLTPSITADLKRVTVVVRWGGGADRDSVRLIRLFPRA